MPYIGGVFEEPGNSDRADWAEAAVQTFADTVRSDDLAQALGDLLGNIMHFCDRHAELLTGQGEEGAEVFSPAVVPDADDPYPGRTIFEHFARIGGNFYDEERDEERQDEGDK